LGILYKKIKLYKSKHYPLLDAKKVFIPQRGMRASNHVVRHGLIPKNNSVLRPIGSSRGMAAMVGGRLKNNTPPLTTSQGTQPESDLTGGHTLAFLRRCAKKGCKDQNCATGKELSTGDSQTNPCGMPSQYHQQALSPNAILTYELAGNATSKIPSNKNGVTIDSQVQMNNAQKPQELVTEKNTVQVSVTSIKEDPKATAYLQKDDRTKAVLNAIPSYSTIK